MDGMSKRDEWGMRGVPTSTEPRSYAGTTWRRMMLFLFTLLVLLSCPNTRKSLAFAYIPGGEWYGFWWEWGHIGAGQESGMGGARGHVW